MTATAALFPAPQPPAAVPLSEEALLGLLRRRLTRPGNGGSGEHALLTQVRDEAGFRASRTLDALSLSLWPSRGLELHGYELKSSRADWLRELAEPGKAEVFVGRVDRFWLVAGDQSMVQVGELPPTWGLLVASRGRLVTAVPAPRLPRTKAERMISRSWLVCLLRAAGAVPVPDREALTEARREGTEQASALVEQLRSTIQDLRRRLDEEFRARETLCAALGLSAPYAGDVAVRALGELAEQIRAVRADAETGQQARANLERQAAVLEALARDMRRAAEDPSR